MRRVQCVDPIDTFVLDISLLDDRGFARLWEALLVCSEGRLFAEQLSPNGFRIACAEHIDRGHTVGAQEK